MIFLTFEGFFSSTQDGKKKHLKLTFNIKVT